MKMVLNRIFVIAFLTITNSYAQSINFEKLDEFLNILEENNKVMMTMAITKNDEVIYSKALGFRNFETKIKLMPNTKFRIGSITKAFTAVIIFQLIDEGKLSLDTSLSRFFPQIPNASNIKISNLLNHSSGLYNITNADDVGQWIYTKSNQDEMLTRIVKFDNTFQPEEKTEYSNTNYILLGFIAEALDGKSYADIIKTRITNKINLEDTYYGGKINSKNNESYSYTIDKSTWSLQNETDMSNPGGAGAIVSTSKDLTTFMNALFNNNLISKNSFEMMKKNTDGETCHGIFYANMNGVDIYASEGGIDGFQSMLAHVPATKTTIALTANALDFSKMRIMLTAFAVCHGQPITLPQFNRIELTEEIVKQYEGEYACDKVPYKLIFKANGNILMGAPEQSNLKELTPTKQHQFTFDTLGIILDFYPETGMVRFTQPDNEPLLFKKL